MKTNNESKDGDIEILLRTRDIFKTMKDFVDYAQKEKLKKNQEFDLNSCEHEFLIVAIAEIQLQIEKLNRQSSIDLN